MTANCRECGVEFKKRRKTSTFCSKKCSSMQKLGFRFYRHSLGKRMAFMEGENNPAKRPEVRAKISRALKGRKMSAEWLSKLSAKRRDRKATVETRKKMRESHLKRVAEGRHNNYKGGVEKENDRVRKSFDYRLWRESVFERDDYTCQFCGVRGGTLEADHIKSFARYLELRFVTSNGRTLCKPCHRDRTRKQGREEWINQYPNKPLV